MANFLKKYQRGGYTVNPYVQSNIPISTATSQFDIGQKFKTSERGQKFDIGQKMDEVNKIIHESELGYQNILAKEDKGFLSQIISPLNKILGLTSALPDAGKVIGKGSFMPWFGGVTSMLDTYLKTQHASGQRTKAEKLLSNMLPGKFKGTRFEKPIIDYQQKKELDLAEMERQTDFDIFDYLLTGGTSALEEAKSQTMLRDLFA